jgi:hypothetical protein
MISFQADWGLFVENFVSITKTMEATASTSRLWARPKQSEILKSDEISAAIEEESAYESVSSDASWMGDFTEDCDKDHSGSDIGDTSAATIVQQRQGKARWTSTLHFKYLEEFSSSAGIVHNLPVGSEEKDYFSLFIDDNFYDLIAAETNKYAAPRQTIKPNQKWEDTTAREIQAYLGVLIYMGLVDLLEICDYFLGDFCVCPIVRHAMTLRRF